MVNNDMVPVCTAWGAGQLRAKAGAVFTSELFCLGPVVDSPAEVGIWHQQAPILHCFAFTSHGWYQNRSSKLDASPRDLLYIAVSAVFQLRLLVHILAVLLAFSQR